MKKLHIVGVEGIGQHEVARTADINKIREVVVVGVSVVEKATLLDQ
jgi:hypothetical protein